MTTPINEMPSDRSELEQSPSFSDDSIATDWVERHWGEARFVPPWGAWYRYDEHVWRKDESLWVENTIRVVCREGAKEAMVAHGLEERSRARTANDLRSFRKIRDVERMARSDRTVASSVDQWDKDLDLLNTPTEEIDLCSGRIHPNNPMSFCSKTTAVGLGHDGLYEANDCPTWARFLDRIADGNADLVGYLARAVGYWLTGQTSEHAIFFLYGLGGNGKSTFLETIKGIAGDYAHAAAVATFTESPYERHPTDLAAMRGARLVIANETEAGKRWNESLLKSLSGGDTVSARFMRQDSFTYKPQFKLVFAGNHKPRLQNVDAAMRRRFHLIPFTKTIPSEERDPDLPAKLKVEWSGILRWAVAGAIEWHTRGLDAPALVTSATDDYFEDEDRLGVWLSERTVSNPSAETQSSQLFASYKGWCEAGGERYSSIKAFSTELQDRGFKHGRDRRGSHFVGLELVQRELPQ